MNQPARQNSTVISTLADLGPIIGRRRKELGLTQTDLAAAAGTSRRFVHQVEHGKASAPFDLVLRLCAELGLNIEVRQR